MTRRCAARARALGGLCRAAGLAALVWVGGRAAPVHAYSCIATNCAPHCDRPVPYFLGVPSNDLGEAESERQVRGAMDAWASVACTGLRVQYRGRTADAPNRGNAVVAWDEATWAHGNGVIGVTTSVSGGRCLRASMRLNGVNYVWVTGAPRMSPQVNTFSIVAHEGGHYLGLGHSNARGALMAASYAGGVLPIGPDDQAGICRIYPAVSGADGGVVGSPDALPGPTGDAGAPDRPLLPPPDADPVAMPAPDAAEPEAPPSMPDPSPMPGDPMPSPGAAGQGEPCQANDDCQSNLCLSLGARAFCTRPCASDDECDTGYACVERGDLGVCLPRLGPQSGGAPSREGSEQVGSGTVTSGCAVAHGRRAHTRAGWGLGLGLVGLAILLRERKRRR